MVYESPEAVTYDIRLSDSYERREGYEELLRSVDLFQDKEVCDMTVAEFSRDNMVFYQGRANTPCRSDSCHDAYEVSLSHIVCGRKCPYKD